MLGCEDRLTGSEVETAHADRQHGHPKGKQVPHLVMTLSDEAHTPYHGILHIRGVTLYTDCYVRA